MADRGIQWMTGGMVPVPIKITVVKQMSPLVRPPKIRPQNVSKQFVGFSVFGAVTAQNMNAVNANRRPLKYWKGKDWVVYQADIIIFGISFFFRAKSFYKLTAKWLSSVHYLSTISFQDLHKFKIELTITRSNARRDNKKAAAQLPITDPKYHVATTKQM